MNQSSQEQILSQIEHKIGMIKTFHKDKDGAEELINLYESYRKDGADFLDIKLFLEDLNLFLGEE